MARNNSKKYRPMPKQKSAASQGKWVIAAVVVGILLFGAFFFWTSSQPVAEAKPQQAACFLVIDKSSSSQEPLTVERYTKAAQKAVDGCREKDASLTIGYFDNADKRLVIVNDEQFTLWPQEAKSESVQELDLDRVVDQARAVAAEAATTPPPAGSAGSNVLAAVDAASNNLTSIGANAGVDQLYLIVLTDGLQLTSDVSVQALANGTTPDALVESARAAGLIPQKMSNVQVTFVGVKSGTAEGDALRASFEANVENFWKQLVTAAGGRVCEYVVDATVIPVSC